MSRFPTYMLAYLKEALLETLWPTRCALCDKQGVLLCDDCLESLPFIDQDKACPRCGSPYGLLQCCDCSSTLLEPLGRSEVPYTIGRSCCHMDNASGHLISVFKDSGEQRIARIIASIMLASADITMLDAANVVSYIPCSEAAFRKRGFDQGELIATEFSALAGIELRPYFLRPTSTDQRLLQRNQRFANMQQALHTKYDAIPASRVLVLDDAYTTGATMFAAADALRDLGVAWIGALTFARA